MGLGAKNDLDGEVVGELAGDFGGCSDIVPDKKITIFDVNL